MHGTRGTTGSEGCLLLYSVVGNSLIFPISFAFKFEAGKPGGESVSALLHSRALTEFCGQSGRQVWECVSVYKRASRVVWDKPKGWYAAKVLWKQSVVSSSHGPAAGGRAVLHYSTYSTYSKELGEKWRFRGLACKTQ